MLKLNNADFPLEFKAIYIQTKYIQNTYPKYSIPNDHVYHFTVVINSHCGEN